MNKKFTLFALFALAVTAAVAGVAGWQRLSTEQTQSQITRDASRPQRISRAGSESRPMDAWQTINPAKQYSEQECIDIYGYSCNDVDYTLNGLISFNSSSPAQMSRFNATHDVTAGAYGGDAYYVMSTFEYFYPGALCTVDLATGKVTEVVSYIENPDVRLATDMSYDVTSETMYMIFNCDNDPYSTAFGSVDLKTGEQVVINPNLNRYVRAMAVSIDGIIYAIDQEGHLLTIDKKTGECTNILSLNCVPFFRQTMEFDRNTGDLYWAYRDSYNYSRLKKVDINTGTIQDLGTIGDGNECVVGLYIPYALCADGAPAKVDNFSIAAADQGELSVAMSWTCPTLTYSGATLASLDCIEIYRNNELVASLDDAEPGKAMNYTDTPSASGVYDYKVVAVNGEGAGVAVYSSVFAGRDLPSAVKLTSVRRVGTTGVTMQWEAPTTGVNNGYIDTESLRYKVTRISDNKVMAENLTETTFTDNSITKLDRYRYQITVSNNDGEGGSTATGYIVNGPARSLPLEADFTDSKEAGLWSIGDANSDGVYWFWQYSEYDERGLYFYQTEWEQDADDWLVSPLTTFESGKTYKMVVEAMPSSAYTPEKMEFYLIRNYDLSTAIKVGETFDVIGKTDANDEVILSEYRATIDNIESGEYSAAVRCVSSAWDGYWLAVASVTVAENMDGNLRGDVWDDNEEPVEGVTVSLVGTDFSAVTDSRGQFEIKNIPEGTYNVNTSKLGYHDGFKQVAITMLETTNVELDITRRNEFNVSGTIRNEYGKPLANAKVSLTGYNDYSTTSDADGLFSFSGVYENDKSYSLTASKDFYNESQKPAFVSSADVVKDLTLSDQILAPAMVTASVADDNLSTDVQWTKPGYDASVALYSEYGSYTFGTDEGDATTLIGVICHNPVILESMDWTTYCDSNSINVVVLALDQEGNATSEVLYIDENADNTPFYQTVYSFPQPIYAPNGCFIGISIDEGNVAVLTAENTAQRPFIEGVNAYIESYTIDTTLNFVEELGDDYRENFFIGYKGKLLADNEAPHTLFNIYRIDGNNKATLISSKTESLALTDADWSTLPLGDYTYAAEAVYDNKKTSSRTLSDAVTLTGIESITAQGEVKAIEIYATNGIKLLATDDAASISLPAGIYIARYLIGDKWTTRKLIIAQ